MIPPEIRYKTHNNKLLAIVEAFKIWKNYLKSCKYKVFILTEYNKLYCFIDMKNLSSRQVWWVHKFSRYYFQTDYYQGKVNKVADSLSQYS